MQIFDANSKLILEVDVDDTSYRYRRIMGDHTLVLSFKTSEPVELPIGCYCLFQGERFELLSPQALKIQNTRNYEYTATFSFPTAKASIWKFRNNVDHRLQFPLTARPHEHLEMFVWNMNQREKTYTYKVGDCIDNVETLISYDHDYCLDALIRIADTFETEYEFELVGSDIYVHLHKVEKYADSSLPLSYGKGNGFRTGVGRSNDSDGEPISILYPQGGERNIDYYSYGRGSKLLLLPPGARIGYDGEKFSTEAGFNISKARWYITSQDGYSLTNESNTTAVYGKDDSLDCSEIYPSHVGVVTSVVTEQGKDEDGKEFLYHDIIDNTIPADLNFEECIINDQTMTIVFQDGMLAGREFDVKYEHDKRKFKLIPIEADGIIMPENKADTENPVFIPRVGDTYAVFNINLPKSYYAEAELKMLKESIRYLYDHEQQRYTFTGTLDPIYAKKNWGKIGAYLIPGAFIRFTAPKWQEEPADIRIVGIKDYINTPQKPELELSNGTVSGSVSASLKKIEATQNVIPEELKKESIAFTKRRYRDARETATTLQELIRSEAKSLLEQYTNTISPITVHTMQTLVGDDALQFEFIDSIDSKKKVDCPLVWKDGVLRSDTKSFLRHLSLMAGSDISTERAIEQYPRWTLNEFLSAGLEKNRAYYIYAICSKELDENKKGTGYFTSTTVPLAFNRESEYNLLVGILSSEYEGERSWRTMYGYTEILPGTITTDRIISGDGKSYFDMVRNAMALGNKLQYEDEKLYLDFLLVNGANVGGWIFRNNRLESADGSIWLDGNNNTVNIGGSNSTGVFIDGEYGDLTVQGLINMSTGYIENNIRYPNRPTQILNIRPTTESHAISLGTDTKFLGRRYLFHNENELGGVSHFVSAPQWDQIIDGSIIWQGNVKNFSLEIAPQEVVEVTCFRMSENRYGWVISNRFGYQDFRNTNASKGRFPILWAVGTVNWDYNSDTLSISGTFYDGTPLKDKMGVSRDSRGKYIIFFPTGTLPDNYLFFTQALTGEDAENPSDAHIMYKGDNRIIIFVADDESTNDGSFDFMIYDRDHWSYSS